MPIRATAYSDELVQTAKMIASSGPGLFVLDVSNATWGKRFAPFGLPNIEATRQIYRELLLTKPGLRKSTKGVILYEETLYQSTTDGKRLVDCMREEKVTPGIEVNEGLVPLPGSNNESWCQGLDGLASRCAEYYKQGARFAKWSTVVSIPCGPSDLAIKEAAWCLARYATISQGNGLVPILQPKILLEGDHSIEKTLEVAENVWEKVFYFLAQNNVVLEGLIPNPSTVTPGAEHKEKASLETIAKYTLKMLKRRMPPAVPGILFSTGEPPEIETVIYLVAMIKAQAPNTWQVLRLQEPSGLLSFTIETRIRRTIERIMGMPEGTLGEGEEAIAGMFN